MPKMKIPKIPELVRTSARVTSPPDTKTMRKSTELVKSFIFCRRSPLNSQNSQQESSRKFGKFLKNQAFSMFRFAPKPSRPESWLFKLDRPVVATHFAFVDAIVWAGLRSL